VISILYYIAVPRSMCNYVGGFWCTAYNSVYLNIYLAVTILSLSGDLFSNLSFYLSPSRRRMLHFYAFALLSALLSAPFFLLVIKTHFWPQLSVFTGLTVCILLWISNLYRLRAHLG
jgi:hypothetical protein